MRAAGLTPATRWATALLLLVAACDRPDFLGSDASTPSDTTARAEAGDDWTAEVDPSSLVGMDLDPWPPGIERLAGALLIQPNGDIHPARLVVVSARVGGRPVLILARTVSQDTTPILDEDGRRVGWALDPRQQVADALLLPRTRPGERLQLGRCWLPGGRRVAALLPWDDRRPVVEGARHAWGVDPAAGALEPVDPTAVRCRNSRFTADVGDLPPGSPADRARKKGLDPVVR